jgi:hypothetical protein
MIAFGCVLLFLVASGAFLFLTEPSQQRSRSVHDGIAIGVAIFSILTITALLTPAIVSWIVLAVGVFSLILASTVSARRTRALTILFGLVASLVIFHFSLAAFDVALSTREFASDRELLVAAVDRGLSGECVRETAGTVVVAALGAAAGHLAGLLILRSRQASRHP